MRVGPELARLDREFRLASAEEDILKLQGGGHLEIETHIFELSGWARKGGEGGEEKYRKDFA